MKPIQLKAIFLTINDGNSVHNLSKVCSMNYFEGYLPFKLINSFLHFYFTQDHIVSIGLKYELVGGINNNIPSLSSMNSVINFE